MALNEPVQGSVNPLDSIKVPPSVDDHGPESPFQDYTCMTGFDGQAWIESVQPFTTALVEPIKHIENAPTKTIYELVTTSPTTLELAKILAEQPDVASILKNTDASYTLYAPTNAAFESISQHIKDASKETVEGILEHHISPYNCHGSFILISPALPIMYDSPTLNGELRLHFGSDSKGLALNYYSHVVAFDIFATNGTIHVIDKVVLPPPQTLDIMELLPVEFSTFHLGLRQTGLAAEIATESHIGMTTFAPRNSAFQKLGTATTAFLFSKGGAPYLRALLKYSIVPNKTLWSNAFYHSPRDPNPDPPSKYKDMVNTGANRPKGTRKFFLPSMLAGELINGVITRDGPDIELRVNDMTTVAVMDGIAVDGVIHVLNDILLPNWTSQDIPTIGQVKDILGSFI